MPTGTGRSARRRARVAAALALHAALAACAGPGAYHSGSRSFAQHRNYPPPGPPEDPWGPYVREATLRFGVPERWVRAVMRQESGGRDDAVSSAGAMGLMQVMPQTYATLRAQYGLGDDPYEPHDNITAGTAYIREMYDRYGAPGFLAAYNAGPNRLDSYMADGTPLPEETVGYLSSIAPRLGEGTTLSGPLAVYAGNAGSVAPTTAPYYPAPASLSPPVVLAGGSGACDPDAAFDPDRPCTQAASAPAPAITASAIYAPQPAPTYVPPQAPTFAAATSYAAPPAYAAVPPPVYSRAPQLRPPLQLASLDAVSVTNNPAYPSGWAIQVGAFLSPAAARAAASDARRGAPDLLAAAGVDAPPTTPFGGAVLYRARLVALAPEAAVRACARLSAQGAACMTVPPGH